EYVEGCTSIAWFATLAAVRWTLLRVTGSTFSAEQTVLLLSHILTFVALVTILFLNRRVSLDHASDFRVADDRSNLNVPLILVVCLAPFHYFFTSGLETPLVILYTVWVARCFLLPSSGLLQVSFLGAIGPMIRPDLAIVSFVLIAWCFLFAGIWRGVVVTCLIAIPNLLLEAWRIDYYAALLPNTYYAKTGIDQLWPQGFAYLRDLMLAYGVQWLLLLAIVAASAKYLAAGNRREYAGRAAMILTAILYSVYVISVGGDFMHGRFWLPPLLLVLLSLAGLGTELLAGLFVTRRLSVVVAARLLIVSCLVGMTLPLQPIELLFGSDERQRLYHGISSELHAYRADNEALHSWSQPNAHPWAKQGDAIGALARELKTELGFSAGGIGQRAYFGQRNGPVFVFDELALTRPVVARIDMGDIPRRIGHKKLAPGVLVALHERVDFYNPYFEGYGKALRFAKLRDLPALVNLGLLPALQAAGLVSEKEIGTAREWLGGQLRRPVVDANFVVFLHHRLPQDDPLRATVDALYERVASMSSWKRWLEENQPVLDLLKEQTQQSGTFAEKLRIAWRNHRLRAIPYLADFPCWTLQRNTQSTSLLEDHSLWSWPNSKTISVSWEGSSLRGESIADEGHLYISTGSKSFESAAPDVMLQLQPQTNAACEVRGEVEDTLNVSVYLLEYNAKGRQISKRSFPFHDELLIALPGDSAAASFRIAIRVSGIGQFRIDEITFHGPGPAGEGVRSQDDFRADFLALAEEAVAALRNPRVTQEFIHSYLVRALCVAFDQTQQTRYLDAAGAWAQKMMEAQSDMQPTGAYYMGYHRTPGSEQGEWYSADSASIAMGVLAVAQRTRDPKLQAACLNSLEQYARRILSSYVRESGGITDGIWELSEDEWWCSTALNAALFYQMYGVTGTDEYRTAANDAIDWLLQFDYRGEATTPPFREGAPTVLFYLMEAYVSGLPHYDAPRRERVQREMQEVVATIVDGFADGLWTDETWWGTKLGGLPAHLLVYEREFGKLSATKTEGNAATLLRKHCRNYYANAYRDPSVQIQRLAFTLISLGESVAPGVLYQPKIVERKSSDIKSTSDTSQL
ncbi:MAG: hypothetical protein AB7N71_08720, partial [Phycisphaerae bacterium]